METKATINLKEGIIHLEGSEDFVKKYLDEFKSVLKKFEVLGDETKIKNNIVDEPVKDSSKNTQDLKKSSIRTRNTPKEVKSEEFDIYPKDKISLEDYIKEKNPKNVAKERIVIIAYYIKNILFKDNFKEGNIEYAYRALKLSNKPLYMRQALTDLKNKDNWLVDSGDGWKISRVGEKFVEEKLNISTTK